MALQGRKKKKKKPASSNAKLLIKLAKARRQLRITKRKHLDSPLEAALLRVLEKLNPTSTQDKGMLLLSSYGCLGLELTLTL